MSENRGNHPIDPELVALKLDKIKNFEAEEARQEIEQQPRFVEMLWFLQWCSQTDNYAGGLNRFAADLLKESQDFIGTDTMNRLGSARAYTGEEEHQIAREIDSDYITRSGLEELAELAIHEAAESPPKTSRRCESRKRKSRADYLAICMSLAENGLAGYLCRLCERPDVLFTRRFYTGRFDDGTTGEKAPIYFARIGEAILAFMDRRKKSVACMIGETAVTQEVFKWLEIARDAKRAVQIIGTERFGKSEAIKNYCLQNPGLARLVETPPSNGECDLLKEIAKALGIAWGRTDRAGFRLRETINRVLTHSGMMLVFDESQFLIPGNYTRNTVPARLNWLRRNIMDRNIPCALVATPQSYKPAKDRFVKKTGFAIGQFDERILKTVNLPEELSRDDLMAIARIHFPNLAEQYLQYVVANTLATERNYVSDVEKIAALSNVNARQAGRKAPALADIKSAIADVLPVAEKPDPAPAPEIQSAASKPPAPRLQGRCKPAAEPLQGGRIPADFPSQNRIELHPIATG